MAELVERVAGKAPRRERPQGRGNSGAMFWTGLAVAANTIVRAEAKM